MAQIILTNGAAAATPAAGTMSVYSKTDKTVAVKDDAGLETVLGAVTTASTKLPTITATVAANALTIGMTAQYLDFRSATAGTGTISTVNSSPSSITIPSTATLGTVNAVQSRLIVVVMNNAGTAELAVANISGGLQMDETNLISTTALSASATSSSVWYSTTSRTSLPYRVVGYIESTQATAGTWATAPSTIQGAGGNALTAMSSLGYGQTYQTVTRTSGTTYYNTTGKPIALVLTPSSPTSMAVTINGYALVAYGGGTITNVAYYIIPAGASYSFVFSGSSLNTVVELR